MADPHMQGAESITQSEHISPAKTGDNIEAKRVATYVWNGSSWQRMSQPGESISYQSFNDTTTDTNLVYLGKAIAGSDATDAAWQIKRYNKSAGTMTFADDVTTFTKQWSGRTTYGY